MVVRKEGTQNEEGDTKMKFATERSAAEIEIDRAQRLGKEARASGLYEAENGFQALYIFLDEPYVYRHRPTNTQLSAESLTSRAWLQGQLGVCAGVLVRGRAGHHLQLCVVCGRDSLIFQGRPELPAGVVRPDGDAGGPDTVCRGERMLIHLLRVRRGRGGHVRGVRAERQPHGLRDHSGV